MLLIVIGDANAVYHKINLTTNECTAEIGIVLARTISPHSFMWLEDVR